MLIVAPVWIERPFCMPPPRNCSAVAVRRCWVAEEAPNVSGADSSQTTEPSARTSVMRPVALSIFRETFAVASVMVAPSVTVGVVPANSSSPTTMFAVRVASPWGVLAGSENVPEGSASTRSVSSSRKVTR